MEPRPAPTNNPAMIRRLIALALWGYAAWYLAAMVTTFMDGPTIVGPIAAALTVAFGAIGWARGSVPARTDQPHPEPGAAR